MIAAKYDIPAITTGAAQMMLFFFDHKTDFTAFIASALILIP
jgi:hypothetical protein